MSKPLWMREMHRAHEARMHQVIGWLEDDTASGYHSMSNALKVARRLKRTVRGYHNPSLIHNGGKA